MLPNAFVILWEDRPIGIGTAGPFKTVNPNEVFYWDTREHAQKYLDDLQAVNFWHRRYMMVKEIQFRIVK